MLYDDLSYEMKFEFELNIVTNSVMMLLNNLLVSSRCFRHRLGCDIRVSKFSCWFVGQFLVDCLEDFGWKRLKIRRLFFVFFTFFICVGVEIKSSEFQSD
ncbi:hypothetical protein Hanom_Chr16g01441441 [Helianthus anomalus]